MKEVHVLVDLENNQPTLEEVKRLVPELTAHETSGPVDDLLRRLIGAGVVNAPAAGRLHYEFD